MVSHLELVEQLQLYHKLVAQPQQWCTHVIRTLVYAPMMKMMVATTISPTPLQSLSLTHTWPITTTTTINNGIATHHHRKRHWQHCSITIVHYCKVASLYPNYDDSPHPLTTYIKPPFALPHLLLPPTLLWFNKQKSQWWGFRGYGYFEVSKLLDACPSFEKNFKHGYFTWSIHFLKFVAFTIHQVWVPWLTILQLL